MAFLNQARLSGDRLREIEVEVGHLGSLAEVFTWGRSQPPATVVPQVIADVVVQDEFTHDAVVPWRDGLCLVFGST